MIVYFMLPLELSHAVIASEISSPTEMMTILLNGEPGWRVQQKSQKAMYALLAHLLAKVPRATSLYQHPRAK